MSVCTGYGVFYVLKQ